MTWDLEERVEDAFAAYLRTKLPGSMKVYEAWNFVEAQYPCVICYAGETGPVSEDAAWHDPSKIDVQIAVITEAAPEKNSSGVEMLKARERNAAARGPVIEALATQELPALLAGMGVLGVAFSMAQMTTRVRSVENRKLITTLSVEVIAEPQEAA